MRNGKDDEMRKEEGEKWWLWWEKLSFEMRKTGGWDEKNWGLRWKNGVWDEKKGLEVSKKDSFGVDGFDSKKHVKVLIFGCLRTRQKL